MLAQVLTWSVRHRLLVLFATLVMMAAGVAAFLRLPIDAVPDLTNVQVQVLTPAPSLGPIDVERLVTVPVELSMTGLAHSQEIRSLSRYGVSAVTVVFDDVVDLAEARRQVGERLARARAAVLPEYGVPELGPMSTGLGDIYQFEVRGEGTSLMELRSILDWQVAPRLRLVPGVVDVNTFGGELRTYEVAVDPRRMRALGVTLRDLYDALARGNRTVGGGAIARGPEGLLVRAEALVDSLDDLANVSVATRRGVPVYVHELGEVRFGAMLRQGAASRDGRGEIVVGMAMMRAGENQREVTDAVQAAVEAINPTLPRGVRVEPFYDCSILVDRTIRTVGLHLAEGGALVVALLFVMLRNLRAGLLAAAVIPLAMLCAFLGMRALGVSGNLMSLGALDFGLIVDGAIILIENAVHAMARERARLGRPLHPEERDEVVLRAALAVRSATAFGELIIALVYAPVLALEGVEGRMFRPMAVTVLLALLGAAALSLTFVPALASWLLPRDAADPRSAVVALAERAYAPALRVVLRRPWTAVLGALALGLVSAVAARGLGAEFVPRLDEGAFVIELNRLPSTRLEESVRQGAEVERALRALPEVETVVTRTGRPEIANDPMGVEQSDVFVMLRPYAQALPERQREALVARMSAALRESAPGVGFSFSQPIEMRMNELVSGVRSDFAVKVYGDDLPTLARLGARVARALRGVRGAVGLHTERVEGLPVLRVRVDRAAVARRGARVDDVLDAVEVVGGHTAGVVLEGRRRHLLRVRLAPELRDDPDGLARFPVPIADGAFAELDELAAVQVIEEPLLIDREATGRRVIVQANVRGRDLGGFADEAVARVAREVRMPTGYHVEFGGQFENLRRARSRLAVVVPLALALIVAMLYATFGAARPALLILVNVPLAASGGVIALALRSMPFSISAGVGFIALSGVAVLNGLVLVAEMRARHAEGAPPAKAAEEGAMRRLRPVLTTGLVASLGFVPMALGAGAGSEVQRPLATVVIGGLASSTLLTLLLLPALFAWLTPRRCSSSAR